MMGDFEKGVLIAMVAGFIACVGANYLTYEGAGLEISRKLARCESVLPRNMRCEIVAQPMKEAP